MYFSDLKSAVESATGPRTDIPDYIYKVALSEINRDIRIREMQRWAEICVNPDTTQTSLETLIQIDADALPGDFLEMEEVHYVENGEKRVFLPTMRAVQTEAGYEYKRTYAITNDGLTLSGAPEEEFMLVILYYKANSELTLPGHTNPVLLNHPDLYLSLCLHHAARWAANTDEAEAYRRDYEMAKRALVKADRRERHPGPIRPRSLRVA